jgi:hypothetical protein
LDITTTIASMSAAAQSMAGKSGVGFIEDEIEVCVRQHDGFDTVTSHEPGRKVV